MKGNLKYLTSKIGYDKWLHFIVGMMLFFIIWTLLGIPFTFPIIVTVAVLKEVYDARTSGFDKLDVVATCILPFIIWIIHSIATQ